MDIQNKIALLMREEEIKSIIPQRFDGCRCHKAFPDQLHTFAGGCSSETQVVVLVPDGEDVSADYIEFLEDMQISYIFA